jgi:hypothetical protein
VTAVGSRLVHQGTPGVVGTNEDRDSFGSSLASGDFDADGYADLAVGANGENQRDSAPVVDFGAVTVLRGSAEGVTGAGSRQLLPATFGVQDDWGDQQAAGDLDGDGYDDLVIGPARFTSGPQRRSVTVVYGSAHGLDPSRSVRLTDAAARGGSAAPTETFAPGMTVGDVTGDGLDDLVISTVRDGSSGVYVFRGRAGDLRTTAAQVIDQGALTTSGTEFTQVVDLAVGDFDGDGDGDLALSDFDANPPGFADCAARAACPGAVLALPGSPSGLRTSERRLLYEGTPGVPGYTRGADGFGWRLAAGDLDADGRDDLAVGLVGDDTARGYDVGAVDVLFGSVTGLRGTRAQRWTQSSPGVPGVEEQSDYFGRDLRVADVGRSGVLDLVVDADGEDVGNVRSAGSATVLYGRAGAGPVGDGAQGWTQDNRGVPGAAEEGDGFGLLLRR